jgi:chromosomal replication initiation ATPase DnaA
MNTQETSREVSVELPSRIKMMQDARLNSISLAQMIDPLTQSEVSRLEERVIELEKSVAKASSFYDEFETYKTALLKLAEELGAMHQTGIFNKRLEKKPVMVVNAVANSFGLTPAQIMRRCRVAEVITARAVCYWVMRESFCMNLVAIGDFFGRDHGTIINGLKYMKKKLRNKGFRSKVKLLQEQFLKL